MKSILSIEFHETALSSCNTFPSELTSSESTPLHHYTGRVAFEDESKALPSKCSSLIEVATEPSTASVSSSWESVTFHALQVAIGAETNHTTAATIRFVMSDADLEAPTA